jgi:negative regulator of sigma E activity
MRVVTAAELEKMTPAERHASFEASIVYDLDTLTDRERARLNEQRDRVLAREARLRGQAS